PESTEAQSARAFLQHVELGNSMNKEWIVDVAEARKFNDGFYATGLDLELKRFHGMDNHISEGVFMEDLKACCSEDGVVIAYTEAKHAISAIAPAITAQLIAEHLSDEDLTEGERKVMVYE